MELETERTYLRKLMVQDAEEFYRLNLDPEVLKFTGDKPFETQKDAETFLASYNPYKEYGVGRLAVIEKSTDQFIGWCGLKFSPDVQEYDIGFRFYKSYWNKGFATETAKRCLDFGFDELGLTQIVGKAMKENDASIKVLEKLGMVFKADFDFDGQEGVIYQKTKV